MSDLVSVIIPAYNSAHFLPEALDSALEQTYRPVEVVVVNDGSTDQTPRVAAQYEGRIRYVEQENRGLPGARNRGMQEARGELFAFLDADDRWLPEKLTLQVALLEQNPAVGLVHCDVNDWRADAGETTYRDVGRRRFVGHCETELFFENRVLPSTVVVRRGCIDRIGLFDESLRPIGEDMDLWLRLARHFEFGFIDQPLVLHRMHGDNLSGNPLDVRYGELRTLQKHLAADPELRERIGSERVGQKLYELNFSVGYEFFEQGDTRRAHHHFGQALGCRRWRPHAAALWLATFLPGAAVGALRRCKQALSGGSSGKLPQA